MPNDRLSKGSRANAAVVILLLASILTKAAAETRFVEVQSGIDFANVSGTPEKKYIIETQAAGVTAWDYDLDGDPDLYFTIGSHLEGEGAPANALSRNDGGQFANATAGSGAGLQGWSMGATPADYDLDGDDDLYVTRWGRNALLRNEGRGRFTDVAALAKVDDNRWGIGAAFADYDLDGDLDLYVANYIEFELNGPPFYDRWCNHRGIKAACGPAGFNAERDVLFRNDGNGSFSDVSMAAGIDDPPRYGMQVAWGDLDADGDLDAYVTNDGHANSLLRNDGRGKFADIGISSGAAFSGDGRSQAGMGVALGDGDGDGWCDIFVTNFSQDHNTYYENTGTGFFTDISGQAGLAGSSRPFMGWATFFFDCDGDTDLDLFVANGHLMPAIDHAGSGLRYAQTNQLYRNDGGSRFTEVSGRAGPGFGLARVSRGAIHGDLDGDGDSRYCSGQSRRAAKFTAQRRRSHSSLARIRPARSTWKSPRDWCLRPSAHGWPRAISPSIQRRRVYGAKRPAPLHRAGNGAPCGLLGSALAFRAGTALPEPDRRSSLSNPLPRRTHSPRRGGEDGS